MPPDHTPVDLMDPDLHRGGPPHDVLADHRRDEPVRWNRTADGGGFWSLTRHADIAAVSRDTDTFSSHRAGIFLDRDRVVPLDLARNLLLYKDPPEHTKYRAILQSAFTPRTVRGLGDSIRARVTRVLDAVIERGACDAVADIAVPVPLGVLADLLGLPDDDIARLRAWTEQIEAAQLAPEPAAAMDTFGEMAGYLNEQIARQSSTAGESLVTRLRAGTVDGEHLDDAEILVFFALLVFAGNDTTRNTAATGLLALLERPDQWALLVADPARVPAAVEELLRWTSVVKYFARTATRDVELSGQRIAEGDRIVLWYTAASRDAAVVDEPERFDVGRETVTHAAFGGGGRHFCLGAGLARLELRVLFEELVRRVPDLELAGPPERLSSAWANALTSLPVRFAPGVRGADHK